MHVTMIRVFNRYEKKYVISETVFSELLALMSEYVKLDSNLRVGKPCTISNIYYDTPDFHLIRTSLAKPTYKEKLRVRAYGSPDRDATVFVEIKKKFCQMVNKRRAAIRLADIDNIFSTAATYQCDSYVDRQVIDEVKHIVSRYRPEPKQFVGYERWAYTGVNDAELRVSFDAQIVTRTSDLFLESGFYGTPLLNKGWGILEIKVATAIPYWLSRLLAKLNIRPTGFSKYGAAYINSLAPNRDITMQFSHG